MEVKTFRAGNMQEALRLVRQTLGPDAAVVRTRDVRAGGLFGLLAGRRTVEVTASAGLATPPMAPAKLAPLDRGLDLCGPLSLSMTDDDESDDPWGAEQAGRATAADHPTPNAPAMKTLQALLADLHAKSSGSKNQPWCEALFQVFTDLIEADFSEELARELLDHVQTDRDAADSSSPGELQARVARLVERDIRVVGPIRCRAGARRLVALVGPTGVGKTTTIAKLAANFRLKEKRRVGLITVDTYRIAAVEQLRTYADIIDLPMAVVSTPREMREAIARMSDLELVLMDTAGRSPRDEVKIQELRSMLGESRPDEVHLVLSSTAGAANLVTTAEQFAAVGATSLVLTKLDEATSLGNLLPLVRSCKLPLSYLTDGQNVPDDIAPADARRLTRAMLKMEVGERVKESDW